MLLPPFRTQFHITPSSATAFSVAPSQPQPHCPASGLPLSDSQMSPGSAAATYAPPPAVADADRSAVESGRQTAAGPAAPDLAAVELLVKEPVVEHGAAVEAPLARRVRVQGWSLLRCLATGRSSACCGGTDRLAREACRCTAAADVAGRPIRTYQPGQRVRMRYARCLLVGGG
jgi:hypothetical protein